MSVQKCQYEASLATYSNHLEAIALLKQHRPYLEMIPSLRRPDESVVTIPLPIIRKRYSPERDVTRLPCDIAILMCDPEWKIKTGVEILVFIHQPQEDFSDFLGRWRHTQIILDKDYEWLMPLRYQHILSEGDSSIYPLFVVFPETPERIKHGLMGADIPFVIQTSKLLMDENVVESFSADIPPG